MLRSLHKDSWQRAPLTFTSQGSSRLESLQTVDLQVSHFLHNRTRFTYI